jgi:glucose-fructose oxidoreductase
MADKRWRIAGINFDHMHMGDLLRNVHEHPHADIVGIADEDAERMRGVATALGIPAERVFSDYRRCLERTTPDVVILCPATGEHALWTERVAAFGVHVLIEKPFAASLRDADRMVAAVAAVNRQLAVNWPLRWYPCHVTAKRLLDEGTIGSLQEVHYYDGNRGPLWHTSEKIETEPTAARKASSWFYQRSKGGGSLLDYLGYGATLGTWYHSGDKPTEVTTVIAGSLGVEVDEHSVTIARYARGLSTFETRWGTFTDPWTYQPQPKCGFVLKGTAGTISSYDYEATVRVQTAQSPQGYDQPVDVLPAAARNPVAYFLDCLGRNQPVEGPLATSICRIGQQIIDTAAASAARGVTLPLVDLAP